ncbi:MAG: hypothetical protein U1E05_07410 [Patescibacteria group bacterium]|nr:hypothetical protein [Patescibacteria group bacterium]
MYGPAGEPLDKIEASGAIPPLQPGDNTLEFRCSGPPTPASRARMTVSTRGEPLP